MAETPQEAFDRGTAAGKIEAKLAEHDLHFAKINGSMGDVAKELHLLVLGQQSITDQMAAAAATVLATAAALKAADEARRDKDENRWSPWARSFAVLAALATVVSIVWAIVAYKP